MGQTLKVHNWEKWQTYRRDRGAPPWIKIHRSLLRDHKWVSLTDAQRGQLVSIWILAADQDGELPSDPAFVQRLCYMDSRPDLQLFVELGFLDGDVTMTSRRRHDDALEAEAEAEAEVRELSLPATPSVENLDVEPAWNARLAPLARELGGEKHVGNWLRWARPDPDRSERVMLGLKSLRDRGALVWVDPGQACTPGCLDPETDGQPAAKVAESEYWRMTRASPRSAPSNGMTKIGAIA